MQPRAAYGERAYLGVAVPLVALLLSTLFECYPWTPPSRAGAAFCAIGNALVLMPQPAARPA